MQYVLGLSFLFKYYRNPANVRIYSENTLLDDISLDKDIKLTTFDQTKRNYNEPIEPYPGYDMLYMDNDLEKDLMDPDRFPEKLFLYTLEGEQLGRNINLEIHNDNTNYTNGFMTKYSYT